MFNHNNTSADYKDLRAFKLFIYYRDDSNYSHSVN